MNWGGGRHKYAEGKDNEPAEGVMDKTWRKNFANRTHLKRLVLQRSLRFVGTCRLLGIAPAPSCPSESPVKKEQSCSPWRATLGGKGEWEEKREIPCEMKGSKRSLKRGELPPCHRRDAPGKVLKPFPQRVSLGRSEWNISHPSSLH